MFDSIENYQQVLDEIAKETGGKFDLMSYSQKLKTIEIMQEYKKIIDKFMMNDYYNIKLWADLDLDEVRLDEKELDYSKLDKMFSYIN